MRIRRKIELSGLAVLIAFCAAIFAVGYWLLSDHFRNQADQAIQQKVGIIQVLMADNLKAFTDGAGPAADHALVDRVKALMDVECTVFRDDTRISTTILRPDGSRATGTRLDNPNVSDRVLHEGGTYRGSNTIMGKDYTTIYAPLKNAQGSIVGMLFIGQSLAAVDAAYHSLLLAISLTTVVFLVLISLGSARAIRGFTAPLEAVGRVLGEVARGNLTVRAEVTSNDELGAMGEAVNATIAELKDSLEAIAAIAERTASNAAELAATSNQLAGSTTEISQGAGLQHTAMTQSSRDLNGMAGAIDAVQAKTAESSALTDRTLQVITECRQHMDATVSTMADIEVSSAKVGGITKVISEISRQTNLLSLNAAIEAAKAGQHGKGFAVVADEIRKLAERSAQSAKEIAVLIQESGERGQAGSQAVATVNAILLEIESNAKAYAGLARESSVSLREQAQMNGQAVQAMASTLGVVERNADVTAELNAAIHDTNRTIEDLARLAANMQSLILKFKLA